MSRTLTVIWTIARRDYVAAVWSRLFLIFLALPIAMGAVAAAFGAIGAQAPSPPSAPRAAISVAPALYPAIAAARARLAGGLGPDAVPPVSPAAGAAPVTIAGTSAAPRVVATADAPPGLIGAARLLIAERGREPVPRAEVLAPAETSPPPPPPPAHDDDLARGAQYAILILTILLSGRLLSSFVEERSGKIVEVLVAAAPVDAIFFGKLAGMLLYALTAVVAWGAIAAVTVIVLAPGALGMLSAPAIGWPGFAVLSLVYFAANFLLFGALLLGLGAHAATPADIQTLALPTTVAQFLLFALATLGVPDPSGRLALVGAVVPWSSPMAMAARAAEQGAWGPHLLALAWQGAWIVITVRFAARLFHRSVLRSGPRRRGYSPSSSG